MTFRPIDRMLKQNILLILGVILFVLIVLEFLYPFTQFVYSGKKDKKYIALTFDDGPNSNFTNQVLNILRQENTTATFFLVGKNAEQNSDIVKRISSDGHEIGIHTYSHPLLIFNTREVLNHEIKHTKDIIEKQTGKNITLFRAPWGVLGLNELLYVKSLELKNIRWSLDSRDYLGLTKEQIVRRIVENAKSGDIILMHDDGGKTRQPTIDALPEIINELKKMNYTFVNISKITTSQ